MPLADMLADLREVKDGLAGLVAVKGEISALRSDFETAKSNMTQLGRELYELSRLLRNPPAAAKLPSGSGGSRPPR